MNSNISIESYFPHFENLEGSEKKGSPNFEILDLEHLYAGLCEVARLSAYAPSPAILCSGIKALEQSSPHSFSGVLVAREMKKSVAENVAQDRAQNAAQDAQDCVGKIAGFVMTRIVLDELELDYIAVLPECRGKGIGIKLMHSLFEMASLHGVERIFLEVSEANSGARALYAHCGFVEVGRREKYYAGVEDALVLEKKL